MIEVFVPEGIYLTWGSVEYAAEFNMKTCVAQTCTAHTRLEREKDLFIVQFVFPS